MWSRKRVGLAMLMAAVIGGMAYGIDPNGDKAPPVPVSRPVILDSFIPIIQASHNEPTPTPAPLPRPEAAVSLEWSGPANIKVNQPTIYTLTVKNTSLQFVQKVVVQVRTGKHASVKETTPAAKSVEGVYLWELGTLEPKETRELKLTVVQSQKGELGCQAWVTFTGTAGMKVQVREPQLAAELQIPSTVLLGESIPVRTILRNIGDCDISMVRLELRSTPGFERIGVEQGLLVGGSKSADFGDEAKTPGVINYELVAIGDDIARVVAKASVKVLAPKLEVSVVGPTEVMLNRKANYTFKVKNVGDVPLFGASLQWQLPAYLAPGTTGLGGAALYKLAVGETKEVPLVLQMSQAGPVVINTRAFAYQTTRLQISDEKSSDVTTETRFLTNVQGVAALRMELVDTVDPIEKGQETTYEIRITNTGSRADTNIVVSCPLPEQLKFVSCKGPVGHTVQQLNNCAFIKFEPVRELSPKTEAVFRVTVKASQTGDVRFKAILNSTQLSTSVVKEESTRVYGE